MHCHLIGGLENCLLSLVVCISNHRSNHITFDGMEYINCEDSIVDWHRFVFFSFERESCNLQELEQICWFFACASHSHSGPTVRKQQKKKNRSSNNKFQINKSFYTQLLVASVISDSNACNRPDRKYPIHGGIGIKKKVSMSKNIEHSSHKIGSSNVCRERVLTNGRQRKPKAHVRNVMGPYNGNSDEQYTTIKNVVTNECNNNTNSKHNIERVPHMVAFWCSYML